MASIDVAKLLNKITQDIPGINTVLKALAKWDVSALTDVPDGAMQATTDTNNRLTIKKKVSGSYTPVAKLMHDVDMVDGYHASTSATANTVAVRNASGALPGNILGNATTANTATALAAGAVVPVNQGGTGATTASQARANLGAANGADFTTHIAKQASPSVEGHVKLDALAADGSNTAAPGGYGLGAPVATTDFNTCTTNGWYYGNTTALNLPPVPASYYVFVQASNDSNVYQKAYSFSGANCFVRTRMGGVWSDWAPQPIGITDSISTTSSTIAASATAVKAVNDSLGEVQVQGSASWSADSAPYPINAQVYHNGKQWLALRANSVAPVEGANWSAIGTAATANLTTSSSDGTAGRVLKVGDGGWMGSGAIQESPYGYPTSSGDVTNQTKIIRSNSVDNGVAPNSPGIHFATASTWGRLRVKHDVPRAWIQGGEANNSTGWTSQVVLYDDLIPSMTGSAILNGTTNNTVQLTDIVTTLGLEVGDVIRIQYSGYDKLHTVESITDDNSIIVNYEHAGNRGNGGLRLADQTAAVTIKRIAKWYNAPIGLGQVWVDVTSMRSNGVTYNNTTGRSIQISEGHGVSKLVDLWSFEFKIDGASLGASIGSHPIVPHGVDYSATWSGTTNGLIISELR